MNNKQTIKIGLGVFFLTFLLDGCSSGTSHLPSPFELPGMVIGSAIENANYKSKRKRVEAYVARNYLGIRQDVNNGGGKYLEGAFNSANIKTNKRVEVKNSFITGKKHIFHNTILVEDALINIFATLYVNTSTAKDKRINGFHYGDARQVIRDFADQNFETLRLDIKQGNGQALEQLASKLRIQDNQKYDLFIKKSQQRYKKIYLEPVVVALMVHS